MATTIQEVVTTLVNNKPLTTEQQAFYKSHEAQVNAALSEALNGNKAQSVGDIATFSKPGPEDPPGEDPVAIQKELPPVTISAKKPGLLSRMWNRTNVLGKIAMVASAVILTATAAASIIASGGAAVPAWLAALGIGGGSGVTTGTVLAASMLPGLKGLALAGTAIVAASCTEKDIYINNQQIQEMSLDDIKEYLNAVFGGISDQLTEISEENKEQMALLRQIVSILMNIDNDNKDIKTLLKLILEKIGDMDTHLINGFNELLLKINELGPEVLAKLEQIIKNQDLSREQDRQYMENFLDILNAILSQTQMNGTTLKEILDKLDGLKDTIASLGNLISSANANVLASLAEIIANQNTQINNQTIIINNQNDIKNALTDVIKPILVDIYNRIPTDNSAVINLLTQILNKIPDGCQCTHDGTLDLTALLAKLDIIIGKLNSGGTGGSGINEGDINLDELE